MPIIIFHLVFCSSHFYHLSVIQIIHGLICIQTKRAQTHTRKVGDTQTRKLYISPTKYADATEHTSGLLYVYVQVYIRSTNKFSVSPTRTHSVLYELNKYSFLGRGGYRRRRQLYLKLYLLVDQEWHVYILKGAVMRCLYSPTRYIIHIRITE